MAFMTHPGGHKTTQNRALQALLASVKVGVHNSAVRKRENKTLSERFKGKTTADQKGHNA